MYKAVSSEAALFQSDPFITFIFSTGGIILKPYIIKRILSAIPLLLIISFVCFVFINLIPSDPAEVALRVRQVPIITEDAIAEVRSQLGLDKPYLVRYFTWVLDCLHGDFGISYQEDVTVALASKPKPYCCRRTAALYACYFTACRCFPYYGDPFKSPYRLSLCCI